MEITYFGHSAFRLKGKTGTVVMDPFEIQGLVMPKVSADILTISHQHADHNAVSKVGGTTRRPKPFLINAPGEYEVGGISVFGIPSYHDAAHGADRGSNIIFVIQLDEFSVCHLGDIGHAPTQAQIDKIGHVDALFVPVGGVFTITAEQAVEVINAIEPSYVIPMHYKTEKHDPTVFGEMSDLDTFLKVYGVSKLPQANLQLSSLSSPEETELVVLEPMS